MQSAAAGYETNADLVSSAAVPVKLCRASQTMILLCGSPSARVRVALKEAGLLVGTVLTGRSVSSAQSIGQYDYVFIGPDRDRQQLFRRALRDCVRGGWRIVETDVLTRNRETHLTLPAVQGVADQRLSP